MTSCGGVATVLTACGIETLRLALLNASVMSLLQQYLPLAVLKQQKEYHSLVDDKVATVLTACGIETL